MADPLLTDADWQAAQTAAAAGSEKVGGDRHFSGPGLGELTAWDCPACGVQQTGVFGAQPCSACGAGRPAYRASAAEAARPSGPLGPIPPTVRYDPIPAAGLPVDPLNPVAAVGIGIGAPPTAQRQRTPIPPTILAAFDRWLSAYAAQAPVGLQESLASLQALRPLLEAAFEAGWVLGLGAGREPTMLGSGMTADRTEDRTAFAAEFGLTHPGAGQVTARSFVVPGAPQDALSPVELRTLIVALGAFLEHTLRDRPEETTTGEWLTPEAAEELLQRLQDGLPATFGQPPSVGTDPH